MVRTRWMLGSTVAIAVLTGIASADGTRAPSSTLDDHPAVLAARAAHRVIPVAPIEVTATAGRDGPETALRAVFASDDLPDAVTPRHRRDLPRRAFSRDPMVTASRLQVR